MAQMIELGLVEFREDHTQPPFCKSHLRPIPEELDDEDEEPIIKKKKQKIEPPKKKKPIIITEDEDVVILD